MYFLLTFVLLIKVINYINNNYLSNEIEYK